MDGSAWFFGALARAAKRRHGAVTREELLALGLAPKVIEGLIKRGLLAPISPGVYIVGLGPPPSLAREAAAILACRPRALLSGLTAARLLAIPAPACVDIHVTVVGRWRRSLQGVQVRRINALARGELRRHQGLPVTSPSLTLLDLAGVVSERELERALNEARVQRLVREEELRTTIAAHPRRRGARALGRVLAAEGAPGLTRSEAERRALRAMRRHGVEPDASDFPVGPYRVDFWFERERIAVEVDGYRYHSTPKRFRDDRRRTAYLASRGVQVYPLTWDDLGPEAGRAMQRLANTLATRRHEPEKPREHP
ncbi:MAG: type IV toxin-antitoxin system AbiEi family antitoxin domain-containing protein [Solirubrobacterales bacterium]